MTSRTTLRNHLIVWILAAIAAAGCQSDLALDVGADSGEDRFDAIRRRLPITIEPGTNGHASWGACSVDGCTPDAFRLLVRESCSIAQGDAERTLGAGDNCAQRVIDTERAVCTAQQLIRIIDQPSTADIIIEPPDGSVRVPPQDAESNSELARLALEEAAKALGYAGDAFDIGRVPDCTNAMLDDPAGTGPQLSALSFAEELAYFYAEALDAARTAAERIAQSGAAVSDAAYSRRTDDAEAAGDALAPFASRTAAAHILVGGELGLPAIAGVAEEGFFTRSRVSAAAQRAIELIRTAAIDPRLITNLETVTIDQLVLGGGTVGASDSIRFRIGHMQSRQPLLAATTADAVYYRLGVTRDGFIEARAHLREEIRAFDRSPAAILDAQPLPDGTNTAAKGITLYGATRNPPRQLHASYWSAVLRYDPTPNPVALGPTVLPGARYPDPAGNLPPGDTYGQEVDAMTTDPYVAPSTTSPNPAGRSVISVVDEGYRRIPAIIGRLCPGGVCPTGSIGPLADTIQRARDVLTRAMADGLPDPILGAASAPETRYGNASHIGRARACVIVSSGTPALTSVQVYGLTEVDEGDLAVVHGRDSLACAVDGNLEGSPCSLGTPATFTEILPDLWGASVGFPISGRPAPDTSTLFVVRRRSGAPALAGPGQWEELTGFVLPKPPSSAPDGFHYCQGTVISPLYDRAAAALIQPSIYAPHRPAESCAGLPSDLRIPLENEITSDAGGAPSTENSWRHYLDLARASATEADALGEDLIRTGLEMDLRAESAADELSRLCGVSINLTSIAAGIGDGPPSHVALDMTGACTLPYVRHGDQCVLDPVLYAAQRADASVDMNRLAGCLGVDRVPWATLGNTRLCIWDTSPGAPGGVCEGAQPHGDPRHPCPVEAPSSATEDEDCMAAIPDGVMADPILIDRDALIGIFQRPDPQQLPDPYPPANANNLPCAALARVRAGAAGLQDLVDVAGLLQYETFAPRARNMSWEGSVGDESTVRYAGALTFRTGVTNLWPMGDAPNGACPMGTTPTQDPVSHRGPLFCLQDLGDDGNRLVRSRMNDLLARAVLAARIYTGTSLHNMVFPYYARSDADKYEETTGTFDWTVSGSGFAAYTGQFTLDESFDFFSDPERQLNATELGSRFAYITGSSTPCEGVPSGTEWSSCPYEGGACILFDDASDDCDDETDADRDVPFIRREADSGLSLSDAAPAAVQMWRRVLPLVLRSNSLSATELRAGHRPDRISELTRYFDDWSPACNPQYYETCIGSTPHRRLQEEGNLAFIGRGRDALSVNDLLNGLELTCWAARETVPVELTGCDDPGEIASLSDAYRMGRYLDCRAAEISEFAATALVQGLPSRVVAALRQDGAGVYGEGAGEFDAQVSELRAAYLELGNQRIDQATDLRAFNARIQALDSVVSRSERSREIARMTFMGNAMDRTVQCVSAAAEVATVDPIAVGGKAASASAVCTNSVSQVLLDLAIGRLRDQDVDDAIIEEFSRFTVEASDFGRRMSQGANSVRAAFERIDAAIARLRITQTDARRALARALMLEDDGMGRHFNVNTVYRARYNTQLERYRRAHQRAVRAAFIARIALEQRLGMPLADIEDDLFSDEAPREWVDTICTLPSIDYDRIRTSDPAAEVPADYSGAYVGDYVRRLEQVFESYSFVHPFREGTDTAVISLRDDVLRSRAPCPVESPNLLFNGGRLDVFVGAGRPGWRIEGCDVASGTDPEDLRCVSPIRLSGSTAEHPLEVEASRFGRPIPYLIQFGDPSRGVTGDSTRLEQVVRLPAGRYRLSAWLGDDDFAGTDPWTVLAADDAGILPESFFGESGPEGWRRVWTFFDVASERDVRIFIPRRLLIGETSFSVPQVHVAGVMLENVTGSVIGNVSREENIQEPDGTVSMNVVYGQRAAPGPYYESGDTGLTEIRACLDSRGQYFRREAWDYGCVRVCADGYDGNCPPELSEARCYRQTSFGISSDTLSNLLVAGDAGFAAGNHNYRIESIGVNLVGTGLRDCEGRETAGCYASGSASYSISHIGPYLVRNAVGALYDAPLFPGRLESARALAAERYITNPLSSADRALIEPYTRYELQGRPLGGSLVLRLWDDPTFRFDRLEDVQVVLTYRYWQHQR